jgi:CDP-diglyceride synthetase
MSFGAFFSNVIICCLVLVTNPSFAFTIKASPFLKKTGAFKFCEHSNRMFTMQKSSMKLSAAEISNVAGEKEVSKISGTSKIMKRWITGLSLGALGTLWIASGNGPFTLGFFIASVLAQKEYYTMVKATGVEPAEKTGIVTSIICFVCAAIFPKYHELVMPLSATFLMLWLLIFNKKSASISEISTSLLGMFYVGFLPSFWVRLRALEIVFPTKFPVLLGQFAWMRADTWSFGAIITWWTWFSIVAADVGAYFIGKNFGKHKLGELSAAAGAASPNKTVEGIFSNRWTHQMSY